MTQNKQLFEKIQAFYRTDEKTLVTQLKKVILLTPEQWNKIKLETYELIKNIRTIDSQKKKPLQEIMHLFPLAKPEGILFMCLAEALLRIPDTKTIHLLLEDKLGDRALSSLQLNKEPKSFTSYLSLLSLKFAHSVISIEEDPKKSWIAPFMKTARRMTLPLLRKASLKAMQVFANHFVIGETIEKALTKAQAELSQGYSHSFDMLGEAAITQEDADRYFESYLVALKSISQWNERIQDHSKHASLSIKLSALHPRYSYTQQEKVLSQLTDRLKKLCLIAAHSKINITIDAEEVDRLELCLSIFEKITLDPALQEWNGLGFVIQAYQKRAFFMIDYLVEIAHQARKKFAIRLVKGAYWDSEIKRAQEQGLEGYPVFTCKASTDLSYLACAHKLLNHPDIFYPQFATHNAQTVTTLRAMAGDLPFEFQKLQGMGDTLYDTLLKQSQVSCRIYAPVGFHHELLPYLVRRLLENGANNSFVNALSNETVCIEDLCRTPYEILETEEAIPYSKIPLPSQLYEPERKNSKGIDLSSSNALKPIHEAFHRFTQWQAFPLIAGKQQEGLKRVLYDPAHFDTEIGFVEEATLSHAEKALTVASCAFEKWQLTSAHDRAQYLDTLGNLLEENKEELIVLCSREGGKTLTDAIAEVREAIDFCRYYAAQGRKEFSSPQLMPGPTGEKNELYLEGRGVFICISPWNFPLAIFVGQIAAALMAGNTVIAKPASQTPLIAYKAIKLFYKAGFPHEVLHFLPGSGLTIGEALIQDPRIAGVCFTGSLEVAHHINQKLSHTRKDIVPFIAETGGQNVMLVDSSALPEQVVSDVITSAFQSAGQRCSALRILLLQDEIAPRILQMLQGAMAELVIGDPSCLSTDIGPVINKQAHETLNHYIETMKQKGKFLYQSTINDPQGGFFIPPTLIEVSSLNSLHEEVFGPILHIMRFSADTIDATIEAINRLGYGLTFGLHTRINKRVDYIARRLKVGNIYVNRSMIGAVVGVQPFGGRGLSGTGPKAGGPFYLTRFACEKTLTINTTAQGGNTSLLTLPA